MGERAAAALTVAIDDDWKGTVAAGVVLAAAALTRGWLSAGLLGIAAAVFLLCHGRQRALRTLVMLAIAAGGYALWPISARLLVPDAGEYMGALSQWNRDQLRGPSVESLVWLIRNAGWYTWPLWPFALWTLYSWRGFVRRPHVLLPLLLAVAGLLNLLLSSSPSDRELIGAVPALVVLAAFGVSSLRRAADNAIDWFSIALFFLALLADGFTSSPGTSVCRRRWRPPSRASCRDSTPRIDVLAAVSRWLPRPPG